MKIVRLCRFDGRRMSILPRLNASSLATGLGTSANRLNYLRRNAQLFNAYREDANRQPSAKPLPPDVLKLLRVTQ